MRLSRTVGWMLCGWGLLVASAQSADRVGYPPSTRLMDQVLVAKAPESGSESGECSRRLIQRGFEAISFPIETGDPARGPRWATYDTAQKRIVFGQPPEPSGGTPKKTEPKAPPLPEGVKANLGDRWVMWEPWRGQFKDAQREDLLDAAGLRDGYTCFAREGKSPNDTAELLIHFPAVGDPIKLCSLEPFEGQTLPRVTWLRLMRSGNVAVLARNDKVTVLQIYENPLLNTLCAQWYGLMENAFKDEPTLKARYLGSLYDFSEYADRAFDPILVASDGRAYFGTMPHHSSEGAPLFAFDPKTDKLTCLGDIDRLAGVYQPGIAVPNMNHSSAFEMNGKVYFTGEDPNYGEWSFPIEPGKAKPTYKGSPILEYDLKTGKARGFGIPIPGDNGLFRITGDPKLNRLYVRRGYAHDYYGPLVWYALQLDATGNLSGEPKKFPFDLHPHGLLIAADSTIFCAVPEAASWQAFSEKRKKQEKTDGIAPQCEIYRLGADLGKPARVATVPGTWEIHWAPWQHGQPTAIGVGDKAICRLDLKTGAVEKIAEPPAQFLSGEACVGVHGGKLYRIAWSQPRTRAGRTSGLYTLGLGTGETRFYGLIVDQAGRRVKDLNHFCILPDGRLFAVGTVYGLPTDRHSMARYRDGEPYRLDCAAFLIDKLPPGAVVESR